jgi:uncharacterized protein YraI
MNGRKHPLVALVAVVLMLCFAVSVGAQAVTLGALTVGQPVIAQINAEAPVARYDYAAEEAQSVSLQAFGETAQPTITLLRDGQVVASEANASGALIVTLDALLSAGDYVVEVGATGGTSGTAIVIVQSATPVVVTELAPSSPVSGELSAETPMALYRLSALGEPSFLYVGSGLPNSGLVVRLMNEESGALSGQFSAELLGGRFHIPAGGSNYRVEVEQSGAADVEPYSLCWTAASADDCGSAPAVETPVATEEVVVQTAACTVSPTAGAVNVRASASIEAPIIATLSAGVAANVLGVAPGGFFYNIALGGVNGWVAASVVQPNGDCATLPVVQPPQFQPVATQPPAQPTQAPQQPPQPTQAPPQQPEPTQPPQASGPCLLTVNSPANVYTQPTAQIDFLQDQVGAGGELIPTGRLADNSWWKTNYGGAWVQTGLFGGAITVSGNCNLPTVSFEPPAQPTTCLLSVVGNVNVYTEPQSGNAFLADVVAPGGELIVTGRLADNSWWKTNYGGYWVPSSIIGNGANVASGNCGNVPVISS